MPADALAESFSKARQDWLVWMRGTLMGPRDGDEEVIDRSPLNVYCCGILAPADMPESPEGDAQPDGENDTSAVASRASSVADGPDTEENSDTKASAFLPSASIGLSFLVTPDIRIEIAVKV